MSSGTGGEGDGQSQSQSQSIRTADRSSSSSARVSSQALNLSIPFPAVRSTPTEPDKIVRWNTSHLGLRLGADACSAASASALVAPIITVIDRSIVTKASTGTPLRTCLSNSLRPALTRPHIFLTSKPFLLIFTLYFSTYMTANSVDTFTSMLESKPAASVGTGMGKLVATSAVNMTVCVYKDGVFARLFGATPTGSVKARIPHISRLLFAFRDSMTIFASFNLPPLLAPHLSFHESSSVPQQLTRLLSSESARLNTAQFLTPAAMQIVSTPLHLLALDLYNRQSKIGVRERVARVVRDWGVSAVARMGRIVPAFGVGGVVNAGMRRGLMARLEGESE